MREFINIISEAVSADLTATIKEVVREYIDSGAAVSTFEINNGLCDEFASRVCARLGGETDDFYGIGAESFTIDGQGDEWDAELLKKHWPECIPTHGLTWSDLRRFRSRAVPCHVWIVHNGRHYDAECPEGVDNFFELPLIRRGMERMAGLVE